MSVLVAKLGLNHEEREEHEEEVAMERGDSSQLNAAIVLVLPERRRCLSPSQEQTCLLLVQSQRREKGNTEVQRAQSFLRDLCSSVFQPFEFSRLRQRGERLSINCSIGGGMELAIR